MAIDLTQDTDERPVDPAKVALVVDNARRMMRLEMEIADIEQKLRTKQEEYDKLSTDELPGLMESVGIKTLPLANGYTLDLKPVFRASLPAKSTIEKANDEERPILLARFTDGLKWLRKHKAGDLIKNTLKLDLGKGQDAVVKEFMALAKRLKVSVDRSETVHPGSLGKFLREQLEIGTDVPFETFGVFDGRKAEIKPPKKGKE